MYSILKGAIYLTPYLEKEYLRKYPNHKSYHIYNSSSLTKVTNFNSNGDIVYSGNIGVGRTESLIKIAKLVEEIFSKKLTIYSLTTDECLINELKKCDYISFKGAITYEQNIKVLSNAKMIIHCENFNEFYVKDTLHSFSTKIADSLCLGVPFLVFAPGSSSTYQYISENQCGFACQSLSDVKEEFLKIKNNSDYLYSKVKKASLVAENNHNAIKNSEYFYKIIKSNL